jgi:hypothetical protein
MLELLRHYFIRPIWESVFVYFPMPFRAVLMLVFVCLIIWIIIRLKNFWKEVFRSFLTILLLPEYFLIKHSIAKKNSVPDRLKYGELLNGIALFIIPIKENRVSNSIHFSWAGFPIVILLLCILPIFSCRERIKEYSPSTKVIDNTFLGWTSLENWILTGVWKEQNEYYFDFISHKVKAGEDLPAVLNGNSSGNNISIDEIVQANKSKYPTINKNNVKPEWELVIPVRKFLSGQSIPKNLFRAKTHNRSGLQIRAVPNKSNNTIVTSVPEGGEVEVLYYGKVEVMDGRRGRWCRVKANGIEGWTWELWLTK